MEKEKKIEKVKQNSEGKLHIYYMLKFRRETTHILYAIKILQHTWMPMRMRFIVDGDADATSSMLILTWMRHICLLLLFLGWPLRGRAKQTSACFRLFTTLCHWTMRKLWSLLMQQLLQGQIFGGWMGCRGF